MSENNLRKIHSKFKNDPVIPEKHKSEFKTPERAASDHLNSWLYPPDFDYAKHLPTVEHETESGKHVKVETMSLSDYEIAYRAARITVEKNGEILNQTVIGNNMMFELQIGEILEYARLMYSPEDFNHLMEHVAKCIENIRPAPPSAEYDSMHVTNGRKFKRAFKKDPLARQAKKEVDALNKELLHYDVNQKPIDEKNDKRREEFAAQVSQPTPTANVITFKQPEKSSDDREFE